MDWDKLRVFQAAADAGSFTHAGETLGLSQSAVSRQVGALESDLGAPLFHRHARGLILTEQGEMLLGAVRDVVLKLDAVRSRLIDSREKPHGELRVTTTLGLGANWLAPRLGEFVDLYPEIKLQLLLSDDDLDLGMREADVALRLREPSQPDLIRRRLFTVHFHAYASADYLRKHPQPRKVEDLDQHHLVAFGPSPLRSQFALGRGARPKDAPHAADYRQQSRGDDPCGRTWRRHRGVAGLLRAAGIRAGPAAAAGRHAGDGLLPGLYRGAQECRAGSGFPRLPRHLGAALAVLKDCSRRPA
jgi:DNA-binding transcriptional LysR family regulator